MSKQILSKIIPLCLGVLAMAFLISYVVSAGVWTEPTCDPNINPGLCNVPPPLQKDSVALDLSCPTCVTPWDERNITNINMLVGYDDLHLRSDLGDKASIYLENTPGSEKLGFYTNGAERMRIDASGNMYVLGFGALGCAGDSTLDIEPVTGKLVCGVDASGAGAFSCADLDNCCLTDGKILKRISGIWQCADDQTGAGYDIIQDEGGALTQRTTLNFIGAGVICVDNAGLSRTDCSISGGSGYWNQATIDGEEGLYTATASNKIWLGAGVPGSADETSLSVINNSADSAIYAQQSGSGHAGYFAGKVNVDGNLTVTGDLSATKGTFDEICLTADTCETTWPSGGGVGGTLKAWHGSDFDSAYGTMGPTVTCRVIVPPGYKIMYAHKGAGTGEDYIRCGGIGGSCALTNINDVGPLVITASKTGILGVAGTVSCGIYVFAVKGGAGGGEGLWSATNGDIYRATGNVGVGLNNPNAKFVINDNLADAGGANDSLSVYTNSAGSAIYARQNGSGYAGYFTGKVNIDGNLEVGGTVQVKHSDTRTELRDGLVSVDFSVGADCSAAADRGKIKIIKNTQCNRDSLCWCGDFEGNFYWICLISCD